MQADTLVIVLVCGKKTLAALNQVDAMKYGIE